MSDNTENAGHVTERDGDAPTEANHPHTSVLPPRQNRGRNPAREEGINPNSTYPTSSRTLVSTDADEETPSVPGRRRGRTASAKNYSSTELETLLALAAEQLPISGLEWENKISTPHQARHNTGRSGESLKRKFDSLANTKIPTGDPDIPPHVRQAKHIRRNILSKAELMASAEPDELSTDEEPGPEARSSIDDIQFAAVEDQTEPLINEGSVPTTGPAAPRQKARPIPNKPDVTPPRTRDEAIVQGMQAMAAAMQGSLQYDELRNELRELRSSMMDMMKLFLSNNRAGGDRP